MEKRPNREESAHKRRRTLADDLGAGRLNVENLDPNFHYRIENDENGKIERLKAMGYENVTHNEGTTMGDANADEVGDLVQTTVNKEGVKGYLLKQPIEFYEEDEKFLQDQVNKTEEGMFKNAENEKGRYGTIERD